MHRHINKSTQNHQVRSSHITLTFLQQKSRSSSGSGSGSGSQTSLLSGSEFAFTLRMKVPSVCKNPRCIFRSLRYVCVYSYVYVRVRVRVCACACACAYACVCIKFNSTLTAYTQQVVKRRPDLKLVVMSATLDAGKFQKYWNTAPLMSVVCAFFNYHSFLIY